MAYIEPEAPEVSEEQRQSLLRKTREAHARARRLGNLRGLAMALEAAALAAEIAGLQSVESAVRNELEQVADEIRRVEERRGGI